MNNRITVQSLTADLDKLLDPQKMNDFGPNGILLLNEGPLTNVATSFSPSMDVIDQAIALNVNALIVHHGLGEPYPITDKTNYIKIKKLVSNNIALIRYHLPLDTHTELGNNWKAARDLGWQNLQPFGEYNKIIVGVKGTFTPTAFSDFVEKLERYYGNKAQSVEVKKTITSAALIAGGAHKYIKDAALAGVDCFITGTHDDPVWDIAHEENISFCAFGHAATEKIGPKALAEYIQITYGIDALFIDTNNPF